MDFSATLASTHSAAGMRDDPGPRQSHDYDHLLGEYVAIGMGSGIPRSDRGYSDRMRHIAEGTVFTTFRTSIREYDDDGSFTAKPLAVKMLRGSPRGTDSVTYAHKDEFRRKQLQALLLEMNVLCIVNRHKPEGIVQLLEWGFTTMVNDIQDGEDPEWFYNQPYLVLEFAQHGTLHRLSMSEDCLPVARDLAADVASGLEFLHHYGIVHGDLKLENILVFDHPERKYRAALSDFSHALFEEGPLTYLGTERYRPPELSEDARTESPTFDRLLCCDIWTFGIAVFELLTGSEFSLDSQIDEGKKDVSWDLVLPLLEERLDAKRDMWLEVLQCSLCIDPQRRATISKIRELLDIDHRYRRPSFKEPSRPKIPTVLEIQAQYRLEDEKKKYHSWLTHISVYGPKSTNSYYYYQLAQSYQLGVGHSPDYAKLLYALAFALKEEDEPSDPAAVSMMPRVLGTSMSGHGPKAAIVSEGLRQLKGISDKSYYARRIRTYRMLTTKHLLSMEIAAGNEAGRLSFSALASRIRNKSLPIVRIQSDDILDLSLPKQIPLPHFLCLLGDAELLAILEDNQPGILSSNIVDEWGNTPLHYASMGGHMEVVELLVDGFAVNINSRNNDGATPLHFLPFFEDKDIKKAVAKLANVDTLGACSSGLPIPFHYLLLRGTPLHWCVSARHVEAILELLRQGADINASHTGYTALALAVEMHAYDVVEELLRRGATVRGIGPHKRSAMHFLAGNVPILRRQCIHGHKGYIEAAARTIRILERNGCNINARDRHNNTPLHKAVASPLERGQDFYVIKALLRNDADRNAQNANGDNAIILAIKLSHYDAPRHNELLKLLTDDDVATLDVPLNRALRDGDGRTANFVAAFLGVDQDVRQFVPYTREDIFGTDNDGQHLMNLRTTDALTRLKYIRSILAKIEELGLAVDHHPDCS